MSSPEHRDLLVSAFHAVWDHYFQPSRGGAVTAASTRLALAEFLVEKIRQGIHDEPSLAAVGLQFLFSLEDDAIEESFHDLDAKWNMRLENAGAKFISVGHVSIRFNAAADVSSMFVQMR